MMNLSVEKNVKKDERTRTYINPVRIIWQNGTRDAERLLEPARGQVSGEARHGVIMPFGGSLVIDFGRELHGGVQLLTANTGKGPRKMQCRIRFGESVSEAMGAPDNDHSIHDTQLDISVWGWLEYGCTGFRFVRIDMLTPDAELEIKEFRAVSLMRDLEWKGSFECSDPLLNEIWRVGAYTAQLCLQDYLWDGIKRDRVVWMGDVHPELMTLASVFGRLDSVEHSLDLMRDESPLPRYMNGISSYSLWWIIAQRDWFMFHGERRYLEQQREYLKCLLEHLMTTMISSDGWENMPERRFLDWPTEDDADAKHAGFQALLILALEAGGELCRKLEENDLSTQCQKKAGLMRSKTMASSGNKQVNALQVLAGILPAETTNRERLAVNPFDGISTFYGYYVLQARATAGDYSGCLELIRNFWGGMISLGATTFWEHFDMAWLENAGRIDELPVPETRDVHREYGAYCFKGLRHSLCHGWASGPTAWMSEHILGIKPQAPGFRQISIKPHLGGLEWVHGKFPTPHGIVEVEHRQSKDGKITSHINLPAGIEQVRDNG